MQKENQLESCLTSPLTGEDARRAGEGDMKGMPHFSPSSVCSDFVRQTTSPAQGGSHTTNGFTLIELLVVVLIIGILVAVALPQYQKAVEKSRGAQALTLLNSVYNAAKAYQLANGSWPADFETLAITIPFTGNVNGVKTGHVRPGLSNQDWSIQLQAPIPDGGNNNASGVIISRISGPYKGTGFHIYDTPAQIHSTWPKDQILCREAHRTNDFNYTFAKTKGVYCQQLFKGTFFSGTSDYYFTMP